MPQQGIGAGTAPETRTAAGIDLAAFREELARARQHVAQLEDRYREALELDRRTRNLSPRLDESPALARACNAALWAVIGLPFVLAALMLIHRAVN